MGDPRYLSVLWPYVAFLPVFFFRLMPGRKGWAALVIAPALLASNLATLGGSGILSETDSDLAAIPQAKRIVVGNPTRGILIPLLVHIPDTTPLYVASQSELLESTTNWLGALGPADLLVTHISYGNTQKDFERIGSLLAQETGNTVEGGTVGSKSRYIVLSVPSLGQS